MSLFKIGNRKSEIGTSWSRPYDMKQLKGRLAGLAHDDALLPLLLGYLDAHAVAHADTKVSADLAAHQFVGRLNMLADLKHDLEQVWREAHEG
jgi:hypothetical protein